MVFVESTASALRRTLLISCNFIVCAESLFRFYTLNTHIVKRTVIIWELRRNVVLMTYDEMLNSFKASP